MLPFCPPAESIAPYQPQARRSWYSLSFDYLSRDTGEYNILYMLFLLECPCVLCDA